MNTIIEIIQRPILTEKMTTVGDKIYAAKQVAVNRKRKYEANKQKRVQGYDPRQIADAERTNVYGFIVSRTANKLQIKAAIEAMYGVSVTSVNTMRYAGKRKSRYTKAGFISGKTNAYKKAIVTLKAGDEIDFYSNI